MFTTDAAVELEVVNRLVVLDEMGVVVEVVLDDDVSA